ncbi:MAG: Crp/Fnr family transcriptional regulator [Actinomycetota bacterium]|nr:Crp/Fnr family transcriptional regulator [Actinomycetota bacterium]
MGADDARALERAMMATPVLADTPPSAVRALASKGSLQHVRKGTSLFWQGDESRDVFFLHDGRVELSNVNQTGYRGYHTAFDPPQFFGELGVLAGLPRSSSAVAVDDSLVWIIRGSSFASFVQDHARAAFGLVRALAQQVLEHESLVDDLLFLDLRGRVAKRLLGLVAPSLNKLPPDGTMVPSVVTHADLASLAGGSRENVTRILSDFQKRGIVGRSGKRYVLKDVKALRRFASL